ncbi:MAG: hypothetical protein ACJAYU_000506 [Bradymonadia bacterium]|jgi:hypothetical protein
MLNQHLRAGIFAATGVLGTVGCVTRPATVPGDTMSFDLAVSEPRMLVYSTCDAETVSVRLIEERRCLRWEYQELEVGVPQASEWSALGARVLAGDDIGDNFFDDFEEDWAEPNEPLAPPNRTRGRRSDVEAYVCHFPAGNQNLTIAGEEAVTNEAGEITLARSSERVPVQIGDQRWFADCGE